MWTCALCVVALLAGAARAMTLASDAHDTAEYIEARLSESVLRARNGTHRALRVREADAWRRERR
eukprot:CAMPEP_0198342176 /NCGR_PEP_ID=MMETSP1450-20131203/50929_1 /TAXON_ID=753684 ORGANISM="Madagascaria erythrocladiodes, Strain CCMP3234" /NCGR_SAMPLE_ID=MMETSP1450 /ASSEMBLY_ACC=CAM_ASM_001115 /LENGTH=64 /DNA_ID=CAMNT_0044047259 /DNA_START=13 /DNA_END=203 /DNA_ORIENTATION=+